MSPNKKWNLTISTKADISVGKRHIFIEVFNRDLIERIKEIPNIEDLNLKQTSELAKKYPNSCLLEVADSGVCFSYWGDRKETGGKQK